MPRQDPSRLPTRDRKMIVLRAKHDTFLGVKVLNIAAAVTTRMPLRIPEGPALVDLGGNVKLIREWVRREHEEKMLKWNATGQIGEPPSMARAEDGILRDRVPAEMGARLSREAYNASVRAVTFPEVVRIGRAPETDHVEKYVKTGDDNKLAELATCFTNATLDPDKDKKKLVKRMMKRSPFWKHRGVIGRGSPKVTSLCRLVQEQLLDTRWDKEHGPPDRSGVRNMLVFTDAPLSAYLTAFLLQAEFLDKVDVILIHASLQDRSSSAKNGWKSRCKAFDSFNGHCDPNDKNKVLVGRSPRCTTRTTSTRPPAGGGTRARNGWRKSYGKISRLPTTKGRRLGGPRRWK